MGSAILGTQRYNFQPPTLSMIATIHFVKHRQTDRRTDRQTAIHHLRDDESINESFRRWLKETRWTDRQTHRHRDTDRHIDRQKERETVMMCAVAAAAGPEQSDSPSPAWTSEDDRERPDAWPSRAREGDDLAATSRMSRTFSSVAAETLDLCTLGQPRRRRYSQLFVVFFFKSRSI